MKNSMKIAVGVMAMLFAVNGFCWGQADQAAKNKIVGVTYNDFRQGLDREAVRLQKSRSLYFKNESKKAEVKINITEEFNDLRIAIGCTVKSGNIDIEIYNPKGEKQGNYSVKSDDSIIIGDQTTTDSHVVGSMQKSFKDPIKGEWIIKVIPTAATGNVNINIDQQFKEKVSDPTEKIPEDKK